MPSVHLNHSYGNRDQCHAEHQENSFELSGHMILWLRSKLSEDEELAWGEHTTIAQKGENQCPENKNPSRSG
jgi:hypothetical protein